jgi:hypothetical protein
MEAETLIADKAFDADARAEHGASIFKMMEVSQHRSVDVLKGLRNCSRRLSSSRKMRE